MSTQTPVCPCCGTTDVDSIESDDVDVFTCDECGAEYFVENVGGKLRYGEILEEDKAKVRH